MPSVRMDRTATLAMAGLMGWLVTALPILPRELPGLLVFLLGVTSVLAAASMTATFVGTLAAILIDDDLDPDAPPREADASAYLVAAALSLMLFGGFSTIALTVAGAPAAV
ncbi:MAG: hypothetical protein LPL00_08280 [Alphaproteobacteria bacterium]|nr:hypothetical protein [Alphaproteobacteria bacterium]MDX5369590.1 hypothetical protein [Alphaproteobacteria bacterium]MDX5464244.1 hypothetical protein [Alphaproteobacteria bacterium]